MKQKGLFVTIEGLCGIRRGSFMTELQHSLILQGRGVDEIHFVSSSKAGQYGTDNANVKESPFYRHAPVESKLLFDLAVQKHLIQNVIKPLLEQGHVVICDEFQDTTYAKYVHGYQVRQAGHISGQLINEVHRSLDVKPDFTFVIDVEPLQAQGSTLSIESKQMFSDDAAIEFLVRTRNGLIKRAESFPDRISLLDASLPSDQLIHKATAFIYNRSLDWAA